VQGGVQRVEHAAEAAGQDITVNHIGSMGTLFFTKEPVTNFASAKKDSKYCDRIKETQGKYACMAVVTGEQIGDTLEGFFDFVGEQRKADCKRQCEMDRANCRIPCHNRASADNDDCAKKHSPASPSYISCVSNADEGYMNCLESCDDAEEICTNKC